MIGLMRSCLALMVLQLGIGIVLLLHSAHVGWDR